MRDLQKFAPESEIWKTYELPRKLMCSLRMFWHRIMCKFRDPDLATFVMTDNFCLVEHYLRSNKGQPELHSFVTTDKNYFVTRKLDQRDKAYGWVTAEHSMDKDMLTVTSMTMNEGHLLIGRSKGLATTTFSNNRKLCLVLVQTGAFKCDSFCCFLNSPKLHRSKFKTPQWGQPKVLPLPPPPPS